MSNEGKILSHLRDKILNTFNINENYVKESITQYVLKNKDITKSNRNITTAISDKEKGYMAEEITFNVFMDFLVNIIKFSNVEFTYELYFPVCDDEPGKILIVSKYYTAKNNFLLLSINKIMEYCNLNLADIKDRINIYNTIFKKGSKSTINQKNTDKLKLISDKMTWKGFIKTVFDIIGPEAIVIRITLKFNKVCKEIKIHIRQNNNHGSRLYCNNYRKIHKEHL